MSETPPSRRILHLVVEGFPLAKLEDLADSSGKANDVMEVFQLTEANAREALEKIFASDTVAVWGQL